MKPAFDVIVVGLGAMGSATAGQLAKRGLRVAGLDRYHPPHLFGSSHGGSRIIREAYFESPMYVPLVRRAYQAWGELEVRSGRTLWQRTGGLMVGPREGRLVQGALASTRAHALPHEELGADEIARRYPAFCPGEDVVGVWEPRAGVLFPELAVEALLAEARSCGAHLRFEEPVLDWRVAAGGCSVLTPQGELTASQLVFCSGAWTSELVAGLGVSLTVERTVQHWFHTRPGHPELNADRLPIFLWEFDDDLIFYGFPDLGQGIKIALHYQGQTTTGDSVERNVGAAEVARVRELMARYLPAANGPLVRSEVCLYTNTPDLHFVMDRHPEHDRVWVVSACSGHGFKFAPVVGEAMADRIAGLDSAVDLTPFGLSRFAN